LASTVTAVPPRSRSSVRDAARAWRESLAVATSHADAHECGVEVSYGNRRLLARWSAMKPSSLSIVHRVPSRSTDDPSAMLVRLRGTMAVPGAKGDIWLAGGASDGLLVLVQRIERSVIRDDRRFVQVMIPPGHGGGRGESPASRVPSAC